MRALLPPGLHVSFKFTVVLLVLFLLAWITFVQYYDDKSSEGLSIWGPLADFSESDAPTQAQLDDSKPSDSTDSPHRTEHLGQPYDSAPSFSPGSTDLPDPSTAADYISETEAVDDNTWDLESEGHIDEPSISAAAEDWSLYNAPPVSSLTHQRFFTVATMVKNQRRWLREWLEFYILMGVEHFLFYDNNSTDLPLEILQHYIDGGYVTYIPWPPSVVPEPISAHTYLEQEQFEWYRDCLDTCLNSNYTIHKQGPCQMAAFNDAIRRTKGGVSRWLGVWDIDEFIFPREGSGFSSLADLLSRQYSNASHVRFFGSVFGTSGHIEHAAQRKTNSSLQALLTEEYIYRAEIDQRGENPFAGILENGVLAKGKGKLESFFFGGGETYARKSVADPDMVLISWVHGFAPPDNVGPEWKEVSIPIDNQYVKFNHYAYLSQADARRKSQTNRNPFMNFSEKIDEFFSREEDIEVLYLVPALKERMLQAIQEHPPAHLDDWEPTL